MTYEEREAIFSKEALSITDFEKLFSVSYQEAAKMMRQIKLKYDRLKIQGRLHVEDYLKYYDIKINRYDSEGEY